MRYEWIYAYINIHAHTHTHIYTNAHTHTHTHTLRADGMEGFGYDTYNCTTVLSTIYTRRLHLYIRYSQSAPLITMHTYAHKV